MIVFNNNFQSNFVFVKFDKYNENVRFYEILIKTFSKSFTTFNNVSQLTSSINFYITSLRLNSIIFEIVKLNRFLFIVNVQTTKTFLNENFDSNKRAHIEEFKKVNSL